MIRIVDISLALIGLTLFSPVMVAIYIIGIFDTGSPLFIQPRVGKHQRLFKLIKFRTMKVGTRQTGTHLAKSRDITRFGHFLRKSKLDELPQLLNVLLGTMSLVGPRPGLPIQEKLLQERLKRNVLSVHPGITGLAQIHKVDMSTPRKLSRYDQLMIKNFSLCLYKQMIIQTLIGKGAGDRIKDR
ncbi:MAG: sugar transferase [Cellvibrionaceae bacterium]|nr:sugar transferase [Cellvibrionaceae bacterium]